MATETDLLRLAVTAHEAVADSAIWSEFLDKFSRAIDADVTLLQRHYLSQHRSTLIATFGLTQRFTDSYNEHYSKVNVWRENGRHLYVEGRAFPDEAAYPRATLRQTEFYNDCLVPIGVTRSLAGVIARSGDEVIVLTGLRNEQRQPFGDVETTTVELLLPHLKRACVTQDRLHLLEAGEAALNRLRVGIALVAASGRVVFCNRTAEAIFRAGDGMVVRGGFLAASHAEADAALRKAIRFAIAPGESLEGPPRVLVPRTSSRQPYHLTAAPLRATARPFTGMAAPVAVLLVVDPEQRQAVAEEVLKEMFGLTAKEAALARALADGHPLERAAEQLEMRYETARTHLRRIMSKTETSRQTELVLQLAHLSDQSLLV
jgi:DNA-binding CsgD family transcriptional regulator